MGIPDPTAGQWQGGLKPPARGIGGAWIGVIGNGTRPAPPSHATVGELLRELTADILENSYVSNVCSSEEGGATARTTMIDSLAGVERTSGFAKLH